MRISQDRPLASMTRREWARISSAGLAGASLSGWLGALAAHANDVARNSPGTKQKSCVLLWMDGGPSHVDLFDPKPMLSKHQGEEIGQLNNNDITYEQTVDPRGCNCGPDLYNSSFCSRDPERTPMQWSGEGNAGFTGAETLDSCHVCVDEMQLQVPL